MKSTLVQITSMEGIASDVRQSRTTIIADGRFVYECLFHLSGKPVAIRVSGPIFIKNGETVIVIGIPNQDGVFEAFAYYNRSSGVSGRPGWSWPHQHEAIMLAASGVLLVFVWGGLKVLMDIPFDRDGGLVLNIGLGMLGGLGLVLAICGWIIFVRSRRTMRIIDRLLSDMMSFRP